MLQTPGGKTALRFSTRLPRLMAWIRLGKLKRSATPGMGKSPDSSKPAHTWEWEPKTGKISYEGKDKDGKPVTVTYVQSQLNSQPANVKDQIAPSFINDNYWLLFPLHAYWDTSATVTDQGMKEIAGGQRFGHAGQR